MLSLTLTILQVLSSDVGDRHQVAGETFHGEIAELEDDLQMGFSTSLDVGCEKVFDVITTWDRLGELMPRTKSYKVLKKRQNGARIHRVMRTPLMFPNIEMTYEVRAEKPADKPWTVHWKIVDGDVKSGGSRWWVVPTDDGKRCTVAFVNRFDPPFTPPIFALKNTQSETMETMARRLKEHTGATTARAPKTPIQF